MTEVAVLFAPGFEEIEAMTIVDVLRRAELNVHMISIDAKEVPGAHGVRIIVDDTFDALADKDFDALVLPGGAPGFINLRNHEGVLSYVKTMFDSGKLVAAICASPAVLADAGILKGKSCTIYPGLEQEVIKGGGQIKEDLVVVDGTVITSRGPATSFPFALQLVETLVGPSKADEVKKQTLTPLVF
jgi:4-methyl-5(b-hydroxyethyl)-thiazole monophosphate biosynthesis